MYNMLASKYKKILHFVAVVFYGVNVAATKMRQKWPSSVFPKLLDLMQWFI